MTDENTSQRAAVWQIIRNGEWVTLYEIRARLPGMASDAGISARLRDFRKPQFGGYIIERRKRANCQRTFEYRVLPPRPVAISGTQQDLFA